MSEPGSDHEYHGDAASWRQVLYDVYKPQASTVLDPSQLTGRIRQWRFGSAEVSDYECGAMRFLREARHVGPGCEDHYFISMPYRPDCTMDLTQEGRTAICPPGRMIVQHTARPSELVHRTVGAIIVRVVGASLRTRYRRTADCLGISLPCARSAGALFAAMAESMVTNAGFMDEDVTRTAGEKLVDLLAIALDAQPGDLPRHGRTLRQAHYARALKCIEQTFRDPVTSPATIAGACGISVGYLHDVFRDADSSVQETIMETRLLAARRLLGDTLGAPKSVAEIGYYCGFSDAAHFSRRFARRFGAPPRDFIGTPA